ncbi:hypothetical protein [Chromobacterium vaccinii]|uniref:hypothetical protein n=1 Tax=Chromobacterium vaccinii TaxID=1108595 RepID=UPI00163EA0DC|nr:hypothetical protein [Chromobacterium vaccinii]
MYKLYMSIFSLFSTPYRRSAADFEQVLSTLTRLRLQETVTAMGVKSVFLVEVVA